MFNSGRGAPKQARGPVWFERLYLFPKGMKKDVIVKIIRGNLYDLILEDSPRFKSRLESLRLKAALRLKRALPDLESREKKWTQLSLFLANIVMMRRAEHLSHIYRKEEFLAPLKTKIEELLGE